MACKNMTGWTKKHDLQKHDRLNKKHDLQKHGWLNNESFLNPFGWDQTSTLAGATCKKTWLAKNVFAVKLGFIKTPVITYSQL
jgi:hypothetical protein